MSTETALAFINKVLLKLQKDSTKKHTKLRDALKIALGKSLLNVLHVMRVVMRLVLVCPMTMRAVYQCDSCRTQHRRQACFLIECYFCDLLLFLLTWGYNGKVR